MCLTGTTVIHANFIEQMKCSTSDANKKITAVIKTNGFDYSQYNTRLFVPILLKNKSNLESVLNSKNDCIQYYLVNGKKWYHNADKKTEYTPKALMKLYVSDIDQSLKLAEADKAKHDQKIKARKQEDQVLENLNTKIYNQNRSNKQKIRLENEKIQYQYEADMKAYEAKLTPYFKEHHVEQQKKISYIGNALGYIYTGRLRDVYKGEIFAVNQNTIKFKVVQIVNGNSLVVEFWNGGYRFVISNVKDTNNISQNTSLGKLNKGYLQYDGIGQVVNDAGFKVKVPYFHYIAPPKIKRPAAPHYKRFYPVYH